MMRLTVCATLCASFMTAFLFNSSPVQAGFFDKKAESTQQKDVAGDRPIYAGRYDFADLAEELLPTVVNISSTIAAEAETDEGMPLEDIVPQFPEGSPFNDFFERFKDQLPLQPKGTPQPHNMPASSLGSGFIIDADQGYIVTNNHVIKGAQEVRVTLHDDASVVAEIVGRDEKTDLAVLKIDPKGHALKAASFGASDQMRVGEWVLAIGNPFGLGGTVTTGIISARARDINSGPYDDYLQTDASINRGNSGGPMFNLDGQVIGVNTAIFSPTGGSVGIGFAIPSSIVKSVTDQLIEFGQTRRGWLGVRIQSVTDEIADSLGMDKAAGALVASVNPEGPAAKAGIEAGDIILKFNGKDVEEMRQLPRIVADTKIGETVDVDILHKGSDKVVKVKVGELEKAEEEGLLASSNGGPSMEGPATAGQEIKPLGLRVDPITDGLREDYEIAEDLKEGLVIVSVDPQSSAAMKGIIEGDVIAEINQKKVTSVKALETMLKDAQDKKRGSVLLLINRAGDVRFVALKLEEAE